MVAPLPVDLPPMAVVLPPATPVAHDEPDASQPVADPVDTPEAAEIAPRVAPAAPGDALVDRIRALTELYRAGMLDDEEFAAAKAVVLRDQPS